METTGTGTRLPEKNVQVFVTMHATPEMTLFDWERNLEELRHAIGHAVPESDWSSVRVYGPDAQGFNQPSIAIYLDVNPGAFDVLVNAIGRAEDWLPPVRFHFIEGAAEVHGGQYKQFRMV